MGKLTFIRKGLDNLSFVNNKISKNRQLRKDGELKNLLSQNVQFKNKHKGERCFIVGNGPSLNDEDLSQLENEVVFTVNKIANHPQFPSMKTNYHFWADPAFFNLSKDREEDIELVEKMFAVKTEDNNPVCFFPEFARSFIKDFEVDERLNVCIYFAILPFRDNENKDVDFTKVTFGYETVVQYAMAMAIYMGFSEIYLLGCDTTFVVGIIESLLGQEVTTYSYTVSKNESKFIKNMTIQREQGGVESPFLSCARMLHLYRELLRYCNNRNIKLVNCSSKTIIDSIPREPLNEVLKRKKGE